MTKGYIQYGCGLSSPKGWINYDSSPRLRLERFPIVGSLMRFANKTLFPADVVYGDIVKGLSKGEGYANGIYASHVLEHLDRESVTTALKNTFNLLVPGGTFRLIVPCIEWRARKMVDDIDAGHALAVDRFMRSAHLGSPLASQTLPQRLRRALGNSSHLWMYDYRLMENLLRDAGFENIRRCKIGDSEDVMFNTVEDIGRFVDEGSFELAIEARRPHTRGQAEL